MHAPATRLIGAFQWKARPSRRSPARSDATTLPACDPTSTVRPVGSRTSEARAPGGAGIVSVIDPLATSHM